MVGGILMCGMSVWFGLARRDSFHEAYLHVLVSSLIGFVGLCFLAGGAFWYNKISKRLQDSPADPEVPQQAPSLQTPSDVGPQYGIVTDPQNYNPPPYPATTPNFSYDNGGYGNPPPYPVAAFGAPMPPPEDDPPPYSSAFTYGNTNSNPSGDK